MTAPAGNLPKSLDEALLLLQADPPVLTKNKAGQVGNQKTKYADLVQVNTVVLSRLNALGVVYKTKPMLRADEPKFVLTYSLKHVPSGTSEDGEYPLKLSENPQQMGSAITYARRYVLLSLTGIAAEEEDDDGDSASSKPYAQRQARPAASMAGAKATAQRSQRQTAGAKPPLPGEAEGMTEPMRKKMFALLREQNMADRDEALAFISVTIDREVQSTTELSKEEGVVIIDTLLSRDPVAAQPGGGA